MVLQPDSNIKLWVWTAPGEKISFGFIDSSYEMIAKIPGVWKVTLPKLKPGGSNIISLTEEGAVRVKNILPA